MKLIKPNRLGFVTSLSVEMPFGEAYKFSLEGIATGGNDVAALHQVLMSWRNDGIGASFQSEWMCLYCASPNSINKTHCTQCGAPRNFILG